MGRSQTEVIGSDQHPLAVVVAFQRTRVPSAVSADAGGTKSVVAWRTLAVSAVLLLIAILLVLVLPEELSALTRMMWATRQ